MKQTNSWIKHFNIPAPVAMKWQDALPEGQSLLVWAIKEGHVDEEKYLQWASSVFEIPRLQQDFFSSPHANNQQVNFDGNIPWREDYIPLAQWDDVVYVACLQPEMNLEIPGHKVVHVLSPVSGLQFLWAHREQPAEIESPQQTQETQPEEQVVEEQIAEPPELDIPQVEVVSLQDEPVSSDQQNPLHEASDNSTEDEKPEDENVNLDLNINLNSTAELNIDFSNVEDNTSTEDSEVENQSTPEVPEGLQGFTSSDQNSEDQNTDSTESTSETEAPEGLSVSTETSTSSNEAPAGLNLTQEDAPEENNSQNQDGSDTPDGIQLTSVENNDPAKPDENEITAEKPKVPPPQTMSEKPDGDDLTSTGGLEAPINDDQVDLPPSPRSEWDFSEVTSVGQKLDETKSSATGTVEFTTIYSDDNRPICTEMTSAEVEASPNNFEQTLSFDDVAGCAFKKMQIHFQKSMMLVFHQNQLIPWRWTQGWDRSGKGAPISINLLPPSFFRVAFNTLHPYHGYISPSDVNDKFCMEWTAAQPPKHVSLVPITLNGSVAGMILGSTDNLDILDYRYSLQFMQELAENIAQAYQRIKIKEAA